jgi:HD-like signal output (HDOD) protein
VTSFTLRNLFQPHSEQLTERLQQLWQHSCRVGAISSVLAPLTQGVDPDRALLAGLVHDIGELPVIEYLDRVSGPVVTELEQAIPRLRGPLGSFILKSWRFDADLSEVPRQIERWERPVSGRVDYIDVTQVAHAHARFGSREAYTGPAMPELPAFRKMCLNQLGPGFSLEVLERSQQEINEVIRILQA